MKFRSNAFITLLICAIDLGIVVYTYDSMKNTDKELIIRAFTQLLEPFIK